MKKGCFLPGVIFFTLIIAIAAYLIQTKDYRFVAEPLNNLIFDEIDSSISSLKDTPEKDSIRYYFKSFRKEVEASKSFIFFDSRFNDVSDKISLFQKDGLIDSSEFIKIKELLIIKRIKK